MKKDQIDKPINAALVGFTLQLLPINIAGTPAHRQSSKMKTARVIFSASESGPSASSFCRANPLERKKKKFRKKIKKPPPKERLHL